MLREMGQDNMYVTFISLLTVRNTAQFLRSSGKFLRSFGKQWEAKLPTLSLIINENSPKLHRKKKFKLRHLPNRYVKIFYKCPGHVKILGEIFTYGCG
jgi:hypothetical protein